jgi:hypothetical protein
MSINGLLVQKIPEQGGGTPCLHLPTVAPAKRTGDRPCPRCLHQGQQPRCRPDQPADRQGASPSHVPLMPDTPGNLDRVGSPPELIARSASPGTPRGLEQTMPYWWQSEHRLRPHRMVWRPDGFTELAIYRLTRRLRSLRAYPKLDRPESRLGLDRRPMNDFGPRRRKMVAILRRHGSGRPCKLCP